jgi:hypothetical protein
VALSSLLFLKDPLKDPFPSWESSDVRVVNGISASKIDLDFKVAEFPNLPVVIFASSLTERESLH